MEEIPADWIQSWYFLTDGWYWIEAGDDELFRYSDRQIKYWENLRHFSSLPYPTYMVARLWEDMIDVIRWAIIPVPEDIFLLTKKQSDWKLFSGRMDELVENSENEARWIDLREIAMRWYWNRQLHSFHLTVAPYLGFYRHKNTMNLCWDNGGEASTPDGFPALSGPMTGHFSLPIEDFLESMRDFDVRLMAAMAERIATLPNRETLQKEHNERKTCLQNQLDHPIESDWNAVREALAELKMEVGG